ncbi:very low affinity methionine permease [Scheffersomyces stipitis CBS 6054]|uniref:Very low affinity methionine permease n=1 Tax=Scheffersomyces stipitis (strain ATCC 58785 / CBS 6054 / NBRC 10063 / NRRL Y-11545) TaxID=322104 RepID=A3GHE5_PICST|nr:very low affinity methionine permease [Scheffersomyces stipitis CBS 6054]EAZ63037.2 very low affinity methionine permease [Scheffersomyces stipitis CBS 6054]
MSKHEYKKLANTHIAITSLDNSSSTLLLNSGSDGEYTSPSAQINGQVSYLQDLEDLPQGRHLGLFSTIVLFVSRILGSGIFSLASGIYEDCGRSIFLFFSAWVIAAVLAFSGLYVYLELGSIVPRSGGAKVFLEFIYEKPKLLATVAFSVYSVMFGFTLSNILVFGEYVLHALEVEVTDFRTRLVALSILYLAAGIHGVSIHHGVRVQNFLGSLKIGLIVVIFVTGIYVVFFPSSITGIESHLHWDDVFTTKSSATTSTFASAIIKASFAFGGWNSVHTVTNEIKDPVRTLKIAGPASLGIMAVTYLLTNLAYLVAISGDELANSGTLVGSLLFEKVFGLRMGKQFLTLSIAVCAGGNVFVVIYTISRVSQEVFREGYLPFSRFMSSNWPFGAPMPTLLLSVSISTLVIIVAPHGDIYNYIVALEGYPNQAAIALTAFGIFVIRRRYPEIKAPIRSSLFGASLVILISLYLLIFPFASSTSPNPKGLENWPSYAVVGILCILFCIAFWYFKFRFFPWLFNYELIREDEGLEDGLIVKKWVKVYGGGSFNS